MALLPSCKETFGKLKGMAKYLYCKNSRAPCNSNFFLVRPDIEEIVANMTLFSPHMVLDSLTPIKVEDTNVGKGSTSLSFGSASSGDDVTVLNLDVGKKSLEEAKKRTRYLYELNQHF